MIIWVISISCYICRFNSYYLFLNTTLVSWSHGYTVSYNPDFLQTHCVCKHSLNSPSSSPIYLDQRYASTSSLIHYVWSNPQTVMHSLQNLRQNSELLFSPTLYSSYCHAISPYVSTSLILGLRHESPPLDFVSFIQCSPGWP